MESRPAHDCLAETPGVLRHLTRLTGFLPGVEHRIAYVRVYSTLREAVAPRVVAPPLEVYAADDQGYEGIACVDDVARAARLALQVYEMTSAESALRLACAWLRFVVYMQSTTDQRLLNFILDEDGTRNGNGVTSYPGGEPWSVRALQAYAVAWRVLRDGAYLERFWRTPFPATGNLKYSSLYALAVMDVYETQPDRGLRHWITDVCDQIVESGPSYFRDRCGKDEVDLYGYYQLAAVARAGRLLNEPRYLASCRQAVDHLAIPVIEGGFYHTYPTARGPQSVFDVAPLALGLEELFRATDERRYRDLALRCTAWLDGSNPAGCAVYDAEVGRCNDKVYVNGEVDIKTGAESAIEAGELHLVRCRLDGTRAGLEAPSPAA